MMAGLADRVFDIENEPMPRGSWWWWFWLFFFDNPRDPEKPRQLMILWSTKNEKSIDCNGVKMLLGPQNDRSRMEGAVASWYFDGERMHHNFLLDQCRLMVSGNSLKTGGQTPTSFSIEGGRFTVRIGDDMEFVSKPTNNSDFTRPSHHRSNYGLGKNYSMIRFNHFGLEAKIKGEKARGTSYFQRVFVNAPSPSWYWGVLHFEKGGVLTYFNPYALGKSIKKKIMFFDGKKTHEFRRVNVKRTESDFPRFEVKGENKTHRIKFTAVSYQHSSWTFRKMSLGFIPSRLVYNEYPSTVNDLVLEDRKSGRKRTSEDFGKAVGNAEHTTGMLL